MELMNLFESLDQFCAWVPLPVTIMPEFGSDHSLLIKHERHRIGHPVDAASGGFFVSNSVAVDCLAPGIGKERVGDLMLFCGAFEGFSGVIANPDQSSPIRLNPFQI